MSDSEKETVAPSNSNNPLGLSKHLRKRYWTSWEEMKLVEFWRRYNEDVITTLKNTPVFSVISGEMKALGFLLNPQECRRKIHQFKNKYYNERREVEKSNIKSEWKLYPLVHVLMNPVVKEKDAYHEKNIVSQFLIKMPQIPHSQRRLRQQDVFDTTPKPYIKRSNGIRHHHCSSDSSNPYKRPYFDNAHSITQSHISGRPRRRTNNLRVSIDTEGTIPIVPAMVPAAATSPLPNAPPTFPQAQTPPPSTLPTSTLPRPPPSVAAAPGNSLSFRLRSFRIPRLVDIQADNKRLSERRDLALRDLCIQQREVNMLETLVQGLQCGGK